MLYKDNLEQATCDHADCLGCDDKPMLFFKGKCHPKAPVVAYYYEGGVWISCSICTELIGVVAVAERTIQ